MKNFVLGYKLDLNKCIYDYNGRREIFKKSLFEFRRYSEINHKNINILIIFYNIYTYLLQTDIFTCLDGYIIIYIEISEDLNTVISIWINQIKFNSSELRDIYKRDVILNKLIIKYKMSSLGEHLHMFALAKCIMTKNVDLLLTKSHINIYDLKIKENNKYVSSIIEKINRNSKQLYNLS